MNNLNKLKDLVEIHNRDMDRDIIQLNCKLEFEPHGRASETWEEVWYLELPQHQYYWENNEGELVMGKLGLHKTFKGRNEDDVVNKAIEWLKKYNDLEQI